MNPYHRLLFGVLACLSVSPALSTAQQQIPVAKEPTRTAGDMPEPIKKFARSIGKVFGAPLHPVISSVSSGSGIGAGLGWDVPLKGDWTWNSKGVYSIREYWGAETRIEYEGRRTAFEVYGRLRDLTRVAFYGLGNESSEDDRSNFAMREGTAGAWGSFKLLPFLTVGARAEEVWPELRAGEDPKLQSTTALFDDEALPSLSNQARYARVQGSADIIIPAMVGDGFYQGTIVRGTFARFEDLELDRYSFDRIDVEAQQKFAGIGASQRLTLHGWVSHSETANGQEVPFYLQRTLGARGQLKSVHEYLLGSDGTQATLRGYNTFRFRDRDLLLLQAEYRVPLWGPFDMTAFYDAGKVAPTRSELNLDDLHDNYGFSVSFMRAHSTVARVDLGLGGEGPQWIISIFTGEKK
jgi:hypothetical protein